MNSIVGGYSFLSKITFRKGMKSLTFFSPFSKQSNPKSDMTTTTV